MSCDWPRAQARSRIDQTLEITRPQDTPWEVVEEVLGSPEDPGARRRAEELMADGWHIQTVLFRSGVWRFGRTAPDQS